MPIPYYPLLSTVNSLQKEMKICNDYRKNQYEIEIPVDVILKMKKYTEKNKDKQSCRTIRVTFVDEDCGPIFAEDQDSYILKISTKRDLVLRSGDLTTYSNETDYDTMGGYQFITDFMTFVGNVLDSACFD